VTCTSGETISVGDFAAPVEPGSSPASTSGRALALPASRQPVWISSARAWLQQLTGLRVLVPRTLPAAGSRASQFDFEQRCDFGRPLYGAVRSNVSGLRQTSR